MENKNRMKETVYVKPVPGFDNYYGGTDGNIYSVSRKSPAKILHRLCRKSNYKRVNIYAAGVRSTMRVHALICMTFKGDQRPLLVAHENGDRMDCRPHNLTWKTALENAADRERHGMTARGEKNGVSTLTYREVQQIHELSEQGKRQGTLAFRFNVSPNAIHKILTGKTWKDIYNSRRKYKDESVNENSSERESEPAFACG